MLLIKKHPDTLYDAEAFQREISTVFDLIIDVSHPDARDPIEVSGSDNSAQQLDYCKICGVVNRHRCTEYCLTKNIKR